MNNNSIYLSDISAIMGFDPYKTEFEVWMQKTNNTTKNDPEHPILKYSRLVQPMIIKYWEEETNKKIYKLTLNECKNVLNIIECPEFIHLNIPNIYYDGDSNIPCILICASAHEYICPENKKFMNYLCKLQWFLGWFSCEKGTIAFLNRNDCTFSYFEYDFDPDFFDAMREKVISFWINNVEKNIMPEPTTTVDVVKFYTKHIPKKVIKTTEEISAEIEKLKSIKNEIKILEKTETQITDKLKLYIKDNEGIVHDDELICTWKAAKDSERFDSGEFKSAHPELYKQFQKIVPGSRRFLIK